MLDGGEDPKYIARRLVRFAVEDIGIADPQALIQTLAAWDTYDRLGSPEGELAIAQAVIYLGTAPKSNAAYMAFSAAKRAAKTHGSLTPPMHILNAPTKLMKDIGYGKGYEYDHNAEDGFSGQNYFPDNMPREEYLPMLRRDPNVLAAGGFKIFSSWSEDIELDPATVDWSAIHPKAFPYRIRQDAGANNALGYIFFPFSNKYGIYMHDTASRWLFTEGSRNFSHGCIRLQNPLDFVEKVFNGKNGFSKERVQQVIAAGQQAHYSFPESVMLHVTYRTVSADAEGVPTFRDDVYGRDRRVVKEMAKP